MAKIVLSGDEFIDLSEIDISELYDQSSSIYDSNTVAVIDVTDPIDNEHFAFVMQGTGFTSFDNHGYATAGTMDAFSYVAGGLRADWTDIDVDAHDFEQAVRSGDTLTFVELMWGGNDKITLNEGGSAIHGFAGKDKITGDAGDDGMFGDEGNDKLFGGAGGDSIFGGLGKDTLSGGSNGDTFHYASIVESTVGSADVIKDLQNSDFIDLELIDADTSTGVDDGFVLAAALTGVAGQLVLTFGAGHDRTTIEGDTDGDGDADLLIVASGDHEGFASFFF